MAKLKVLSNNEQPEPKPESFKAWKDEEAKTEQTAAEAPKRKKTGGKGYVRKFKKGNQAKVILSKDELTQLEAMSEQSKAKVMVKKAQEAEVRKRLGLENGEPIPKLWLQGGSKFNLEAMAIFCEEYAKHNLMTKAAAVAGVNPSTVRNHLKTNPMFEEKVAEAKAQYRDKIVETVYERAVTGIEEPIVGGMGRDTIIGYKRVFSDRLLELEAKRVEHGYRDKGGVEINTGSGVLVVQAGNMDEASWEEKYGAMEAGPSE